MPDFRSVTRVITRGNSAVESRCEPPNTRRLTFEYHAFVFALRRSLDYLAVSVGAFFKTIDLLREVLPTLDDLLPADKQRRRAARDILAHWKALTAQNIPPYTHLKLPNGWLARRDPLA